jgi:hypothetical protein
MSAAVLTVGHPDWVMYRSVAPGRLRARVQPRSVRGCEVYWGVGFGLLYLVLLITLGVITLRKGHWVMFIIGLFFPILWLIGAVIPPVTPRPA